MNLKFVEGRGYKAHNTREIEKKHKEAAETGEGTTAQEEQEAPVPLVNHVNNNLLSIFSNVEMYINIQQIYISN